MTIARWYTRPERYYTAGDVNEKMNGCYAPSVNVVENDDAFRLELAVPGYSKEDFRISVEKDTLSVSVEKEVKAENSFLRREFATGNFCRSFLLPKTVEADQITAEYSNGILKIMIPKKEEVKIRKEIQVA